MLRKALLITGFISSYIFSQSLDSIGILDSINVSTVIKNVKKEMREQIAKNPKFKWELIPIVYLPIDLYQNWKLPSCCANGAKIINFEGMGGVVWKKENSCFLVISTNYNYILEWWSQNKVGTWNMYSCVYIKKDE